MEYLAVVRKDDDSDFGVEFPDVTGCFSAGSNLDEAIEMAREALLFHLEGVLNEGGALPRCSTYQEIYSTLVADSEGVATILPIRVDEDALGGSQRINISVNRILLGRIDQAATAAGMTRSGFLATASRALLDAQQ